MVKPEDLGSVMASIRGGGGADEEDDGAVPEDF
jgi:S-DNA-T family DNA segregation ATPase FtsK/SpoIIIE